jgi:hypothetical protein
MIILTIEDFCTKNKCPDKLIEFYKNNSSEYTLHPKDFKYVSNKKFKDTYYQVFSNSIILPDGILLKDKYDILRYILDSYTTYPQRSLDEYKNKSYIIKNNNTIKESVV